MKKKIEQIKDSIKNSPKLSEEQKSSSYKIMEEWAEEDKASGILFEKLAEISEEIEPILVELGLV
ncbi:MAG: hypothetical protein KAU90_02750 [Sulfurovaceae bacterium]|nr:hypothetical protein [Sulfurovaceae bacterium]